jgi:hypothetical protein
LDIKEPVMHLFFDIQHRGELFLDEEGEEFSCMGGACDHLARVLCAFVESGGELDDIRDMVINITDRGKLRLVCRSPTSCRNRSGGLPNPFKFGNLT